MTLTHKTIKNHIIVTINDSRLDALTANNFKEYMVGIIQKENLPIILDLTQVSFMDSSGLGAVVAVRKELLAERNQMMYLVSAQPSVQDLLTLTCMDKVFEIYASVDEALQNS